MLHKILEKVATAAPMTWITLNVVAPLDRRLLKVSVGRYSLTGQTTVLLVTRGAKSGLLRYTALPALYYDEDIVFLASKGGSTKHPAWYHNLLANPRVEVFRAGQRLSCHARTVSGDEREQIWHWLLEQWQGFGVYQERTNGRIMPIVALRIDTQGNDELASNEIH